MVILGLLAFATVQLASEKFFGAPSWANPLDALVIETTWIPAILDTLLAFVLGAIGAIFLGVVFGFGRISRFALTRWASTGYVQFFRSLPLVLLIWISFTIDGHFGFTTDDLGWTNEARRLTFLVRAWRSTTPRSWPRSCARAWRPCRRARRWPGTRWACATGRSNASSSCRRCCANMLPAVLAQLVILLKDTSLGYVITYPELLHSANLVGRDYGNSYLQALIIAAFIYFVLAYALSKLVVVAERRLREEDAPRPRRSSRSRSEVTEWPVAYHQPLSRATARAPRAADRSKRLHLRHSHFRYLLTSN